MHHFGRRSNPFHLPSNTLRYLDELASVRPLRYWVFDALFQEQVDALIDRKESLKQELNKTQEELQTTKENHRCV